MASNAGSGRMDRIAGMIQPGKARKAKLSAQQARQEQQTAIVRSQQDAANASVSTQDQLSRVRRTPRGRRQLLSEASRLG